MKTRRLYFDDAYMLEFSAKVENDSQYEGKPAVVLDQTCFYPESGGQPSDRGRINGIDVVDVIDGEEIIHVLSDPLDTEKAEGRVNGQVRMDHMQQHAGQHILSQCFLKILDARTTSFHLGALTSTVEMDLRDISEKEVLNIEKRANEIVIENRDIKTYFVEEDGLDAVPLRKPPHKKGRIRVVEIEGFDFTACGGTHPRKTGEVGLIKILKWERIRNNIRFEFACGWRAFNDYVQKHSHMRCLSKALTAKEDEVVSIFEKMQCELKSEKRNNRKLREAVIQFEADLLIREDEGSIIQRIFKDRSAEDLRLLVSNVIRKGDYCALFGSIDKERVSVVLGRSDALDVDLRELVPVISLLISGKGGGQPSLVQMTGEKGKALEKALEQARTFVLDALSGNKSS